jgi:deoxycytidylate deaminase
MFARQRKIWPLTALNLAYSIAEDRSEDPYVQVGAVAKKYDNSLIVGYNGSPSGIEIDWSNRDQRRAKVVHAEENVLNYCRPGEVEFLACTHIPCPSCLKTIAIKKVSKVFFRELLENYAPDVSYDLAREFKISLLKI